MPSPPRTVGHPFQSTNAGILTRRYILHDYNSAGLETSFEDDDENMDQWLNARLDSIRSMSRKELEWELYHNDVDCRGSHEELVCRLLKARLETSHKISTPPEEYLAQGNKGATRQLHFEDEIPMIFDEEPTISSYEDHESLLEADMEEDLSPDQHWSTTNNRQAAISLDDYDDSRRRQHFERNKEWFNDRKSSSHLGNQNQFIIDDEHLGGTASFSNTGSTTFPNEYIVQPEQHQAPYENPHYPDSHFYDEFEVTREPTKRQPRDLYRPNTHPKTNAHEQSQGRALYKIDERPTNKIYRELSCIELPMSMSQGVPVVYLHLERNGQFDNEPTQFIIDTARHTSALCATCAQRPNLPATSGSSSITTKSATTPFLKSAQDESELPCLPSFGDDDAEASITEYNDSVDANGSLSSSKEIPEMTSYTDEPVLVDGFWTHDGVFFEAPVEMEILEEDEQMLHSPHGYLGMDVLSTFDSVDFDFEQNVLRLHTGDPQSPHFVMAEAKIQPLSLTADLPDLYTLPLRVDAKGPANMLISTALPNTVMTWKGVNDSLGLSRHSNEISDIESTFSPYSTVASHFTHHLTVHRKLDFGSGKRLIRLSDMITDDSPSLPGLPHLVGMDIPVGQFPTNIGHNEELNKAFERKRTGGIIGMDILSRCSVLRLALDRTMEIQMISRHSSQNHVVLRP